MSFKYISLFIIASAFSFHFSFAQNTSKYTKYSNAAKYDKIVDLEHTKLKVSFDFSNSTMDGEAWLRLSPHFYAIQELVLDAKAMLIHEVFLFGKKAPYTYDGEKITLSLGKEYRKQEAIEIYIKYTAQPEKVKQKGSSAISEAKGLYFINPKGLNPNKPTQIWTQGETEASSCWFPTIDSPNQKTTQEIYITVEDKYTTLSNGALVSQKSLGNGMRTDYWKMDQKHAPYLFFMGVGEFSVVKDEWRGKIVDYYVEKEYEPLARKIFGMTPKMLDFFSEITGVPYMWDKYSQMVGRDFVSGAMENTTAVLHGTRAYQEAGELVDENTWERVIAHELFHHWFGDYVTTENWSNLTLNESFATYSTYLWFFHEYGADKANSYLFNSIEGYKNGQNESKCLVRFDYADKEDMFDGVSYNKGGAILHMLRNFLGDEAFFEGIKKYLKDNKFSAAEAHQLRLAFEAVSGKDLNWFFDQWYYNAGHPYVKVSYDYNLLEKTVAVNIDQTGDNTFYFPLKIDIHEKGKKVSHEVFVDAKEKSFVFSYVKDPKWISVNADHVVLGDFVENKPLGTYLYQLKHATHYIDRREALLELVKHQETKEVFKAIVNAFEDPYYEIQVLALENIDLSYKYSKKRTIDKIEYLAKKAKHNYVRAAAIKVLGRLVYFDYQSVFEKSFESESNAVKGAALEALYYLNEQLAMSKAKNLPAKVKEAIAFPLSKMYLEQKDVSEMEFVSKYVMQGVFVKNDEETSKLFKKAFEWIAKGNNIEAFKNLADDMVAKGLQYKKYNFHLEVIQMFKFMVNEQEKSANSHKEELLSIAKKGLSKLIE